MPLLSTHKCRCHLLVAGRSVKWKAISSWQGLGARGWKNSCKKLNVRHNQHCVNHKRHPSSTVYDSPILDRHSNASLLMGRETKTNIIAISPTLFPYARNTMLHLLLDVEPNRLSAENAAEDLPWFDSSPSRLAIIVSEVLVSCSCSSSILDAVVDRRLPIICSSSKNIF
jgi:hypothetical protein